MDMFSLGKAVIVSTLSILVTLIRHSMMVYTTLETGVKVWNFMFFQNLQTETHTWNSRLEFYSWRLILSKTIPLTKSFENKISQFLKGYFTWQNRKVIHAIKHITTCLINSSINANWPLYSTEVVKHN